MIVLVTLTNLWQVKKLFRTEISKENYFLQEFSWKWFPHRLSRVSLRSEHFLRENCRFIRGLKGNALIQTRILIHFSFFVKKIIIFCCHDKKTLNILGHVWCFLAFSDPSWNFFSDKIFYICVKLCEKSGVVWKKDLSHVSLLPSEKEQKFLNLWIFLFE